MGALLLAAVGMPLAWPTVRLPIAIWRAQREASPPLRFYRRAVTQRGVRSLLVAEILWVIGYAPLPVFFLYARAVLGSSPGSHPVARRVRRRGGSSDGGDVLLRSQHLHKPLLSLGVAFMGRLPGRRCHDKPRGRVGGLRGGRGGIRPDLDARVLALRLADPARRVGRLHRSLLPSAVAAALAVPLAGVAAAMVAIAIFVLGGVATLAALVPLAFAMSPRAAADSTRLLR